MMNPKDLLIYLGYIPKEKASDIFHKKYTKHNGYIIEVDLKNEKFNYGRHIKIESGTTGNFSKPENWVVLECVNRLLEIGYPPKNIILEKTWPSGHGTSGRLDILVLHNNGTSYLMIECKTWGQEFEKESKRIFKDGGQLFTYFQQDKNASFLMLYTSILSEKNIVYKNEIIKIEDEYKHTGNVKDFYDRWNKLTKPNGIFESWVTPYEYHSKALTKSDLIVLKQTDSSFIFNRFLEILRHNVVSDKPNAFNKIFNLFLCKIVDENRSPDEQLHFQWIDGEDTHITFQKRLTDLYNRGMLELLEKQVTDVSDTQFDKEFYQVEEQYKEKFKEILTEIRLKKNNEFAIKEVYDDPSFYENAKVVKEVVELLQVFQLRYNYRQQFLSDFFELLLTTGLKQESGQFFTPVPITRFIIKSLPIPSIITKKLAQGNKNDLLPTIIDYAAGSGHFLTESMEEIQKFIDGVNTTTCNPATQRSLKKWKDDQFDWADDYIYGIEKDYRLVKTAKVSCYLHGDGLAKVIHGDGLDNFSTSIHYKDLLKLTDRAYPQDNKQFDIVISNPPYSVSAFKGTMIEESIAKTAFNLYSRLTDQSSEIECLFIERTKQLLKDNGVAGIILPTSILDNNSILNIQAREILLQYFDVLGLFELGTNTFMATDIKTVIMFLRRRNNADAKNIRASVEKYFSTNVDITINGIEKPVAKYIKHTWGDINLNDYNSLLKLKPNIKIIESKIYIEYLESSSTLTKEEHFLKILEIEKQKITYFIITYPQKIVQIKSGDKSIEKEFLGYEFSNRRGSEGIHAIKRHLSIDECTQLYDAKSYENPKKAAYYIYNAFNGKFDLPISDPLKGHIRYLNLVDLLDFTESSFDKKIKQTTKTNIKYSEIWKTENLQTISSIALVKKGTSITKAKTIPGKIPVIAGGKSEAYTHNKSNRDGNVITVSASGAYAGFLNYFEYPIFASDCNTIQSKDETRISTRFLYYLLKVLQPQLYSLQRGQAQPHVYREDIEKIKIPVIDPKLQLKIMKEITALVKKSKTIVVEDIEGEIANIIKRHIK